MNGKNFHGMNPAKAHVSILRPLFLSAGLLVGLCGMLQSQPTLAGGQSGAAQSDRMAARANQQDLSSTEGLELGDGVDQDEDLADDRLFDDSLERSVDPREDVQSATSCTSTNVNGKYEVIEYATYKCSIYTSSWVFIQTNYISFDYTWRGTDACGNEMLRGYYTQTAVSPTTGGFTFAKPVNKSTYTAWEYTDNTAAWQCKSTNVGIYNGKGYMDGYTCTDNKIRICDQL